VNLRKTAACALVLSFLLAFPRPAAALDAPSLTAFSATSTSVIFSWAAMSEADSYWPLLYDGNTKENLQQQVVDKSVMMHTFSGLAPNTLYIIAVASIKGNEVSTLDNVYCSRYFTTAPAMPAGSSIKASDIRQTSATLTWTAETLPAGCSYRIERLSPSWWYDVTTNTSYTVSDLTPGTTYTYRYCLHREGDNAFSDYKSVTFTTPAAPAAPAKPEGFAVTGRTANSITLGWTSSYPCQVMRTDSTYSTTYETKNNASGSATFTGLAAGAEYFFKIQAVNGTLVSAFAQTSGVTTPARPGNPVQTGSSAGSVSITWTAPSGSVDSYVLRLAGGAGAGTFTTSTAAPSFEFTGLAPGTEYTVTVASRLKGLESEQTTPLKVSTLSSDSVAVPQGVRVAAVTQTTVKLEWNGQPDTDGFLIYRSDSADGSYTEVGEVKGSTAFTDTGLQPGAAYYYRIRAYRFLGQSQTKQWSVDSNVVSAKTTAPAIPDTPKDLSARYRDDLSVMVIWTASENADGYVVYRSNSKDGEFVQAAVVKDTNRWIDTGAPTTDEWYYSVSAVNESGESKRCEPVRALIPEGSDIAVQFLLSSDSVSADGTALSWDAVEGAAQYYVYRSFAENSAYSLIANVTDTNYTDSGLPASTEVFYQVSACDALNREIGFSNDLKVVTLPAPPTKQNTEPDVAAPDVASKVPFAVILGGLAVVVLILVLLIPASCGRRKSAAGKTQRRQAAVRGNSRLPLPNARKTRARASGMRKSG